ncbi:XRE family transcriptional regulator [bacterium]|nr:XRE family transcriptional regulator [bacterium]MBD8922683.1 XRE family transcriptional regulator [bacterium]
MFLGDKMNRIKELREDHDLKQKDVAKILNVSQQQYARYELKENEMSYCQLIKLADFYNTSIDYILYVTDERKPYPKSIIK